MIIDTSLIDAYCNFGIQPNPNSWFYPYCGGYVKAADNRQEVCAALLEECQKYATFPLWNRSLALRLFPNCQKELESLILFPIIGTNPQFDCNIQSYESHTYLLIDLLHIADYTQSVKEMSYILHNLCHLALYQYVMNNSQDAPKTYMETLEHLFFIHGYAQYLAWNESHEQYVFQNPNYTKKKERAFLLLEKAIQVEDVSLQREILHQLDHASLWDRFPEIAGMFFLDDVNRIYGEDGIVDFYQQGMQNCLFRIFEN